MSLETKLIVSGVERRESHKIHYHSVAPLVGCVLLFILSLECAISVLGKKISLVRRLHNLMIRNSADTSDWAIIRVECQSDSRSIELWCNWVWLPCAWEREWCKVSTLELNLKTSKAKREESWTQTVTVNQVWMRYIASIDEWKRARGNFSVKFPRKTLSFLSAALNRNYKTDASRMTEQRKWSFYWINSRCDVEMWSSTITNRLNRRHETHALLDNVS